MVDALSLFFATQDRRIDQVQGVVKLFLVTRVSTELILRSDPLSSCISEAKAVCKSSRAIADSPNAVV